MRSLLIPTLTAAALAAVAAPAGAQIDRYGGYAAYPSGTPEAAPVQQRPSRVLTWPGKTIPAAPPAQVQLQGQPQAYPAPYGYPAPLADGQLRPPPYAAYAQPRPMYPASYYAPRQGHAPAPQQRPQPRQAPPQQQAVQLRPAMGYAPPLQAQGRPYPVQPYYAPPAAPTPAPGSTATAPNGVYPAGVVPPQLVYPMGVQPQPSGQIVGPQSQQSRQPPLPASIYAPPPPAPQAQAQPAEPGGADPRQPQRVAMNTESARLYSVHRQFGMTPDPTPPAPPEGEPVQLVSPIDSPTPDPDGEVDRPDTRRITSASGKTTVVRTRGSSGADD